MKLLPLLLLSLLPICLAAQTQHKEPCDNDMTFCWYGPYKDNSDEVKAWGKRWVAKEQKAAEIDFPAAFRCIKRLGLCIKAEDIHFSGGTIQRIELLPVGSWSSEQITASAENAKWEPCNRDSYIINRLDRSVLLISSPGPQADTQNCKGLLGAPKTTVYRLAQ